MWNVQDCYKGLPLEVLQEKQKELSLPFSLCVVNVNGDLNVGNIIRTGCVFGAEKIFVFGKRRYDKRSCVGSYNYVTVECIEADLNSDENQNGNGNGNGNGNEILFSTLEKYSYEPVFIEQGGSFLHETNLSSFSRPCFIFGNEGKGFSDEFIGDKPRISIAQRGILRSLNVANTAAIICHSYVYG